MPTLKTTLIWHDSRGEECQADARVSYALYRGYPDTLEDPGCTDSVEIQDIRDNDNQPLDYPYDDPELIDECLSHYRDECIAVEEYRAEMRRDERDW